MGKNVLTSMGLKNYWVTQGQFTEVDYERIRLPLNPHPHLHVNLIWPIHKAKNSCCLLYTCSCRAGLTAEASMSRPRAVAAGQRLFPFLVVAHRFLTNPEQMEAPMDK